jgi:Pyridoxamine 5'-phosphate oxidase
MPSTLRPTRDRLVVLAISSTRQRQDRQFRSGSSASPRVCHADPSQLAWVIAAPVPRFPADDVEEFGVRSVSGCTRPAGPALHKENTVQASEIIDVLNQPISQELLARDLSRLAYVAKDGTPRSIPIGFNWNGTEIVMCTSKNAPKLPALRHNPAVAPTVDPEVHPPKILLIRGRAELDVVEGIPDEYLEMSGTYTMTPEQRVEWEAEVRSLHEGMVPIVVTPTWAKLIDFETTLRSAVEELARQREERQSR